ncbi:MAG: metal-sensitive transcriptional regulator [Gemmatimonadaceae bacterium]
MATKTKRLPLTLGPGASCGCATHGESRGQKAIAVDAEIKDCNLKRLRRIEGQVRGVAGMVGDDRYCADIMTQISAVQEALRSVGRELMRNHLKHCASSAIRSGGGDADAMYDELLDLMHKYNR